MYRKIMGFLEAWKESKHRKPLILQGARQVGKTYSILEFGRTHYENVAYFNFETNPKLNETFEEAISPDYLIPILSHIAGQTIVKGKDADCIRRGAALRKGFDFAQILLRECSGLSHHRGRQLARRCSEQREILFSCRKGRYENALSYGYGRIYVGAR